MDLRGLGQIGPDRYIIAGGMIEGQQVTNTVFELQLDLPTGIIDRSKFEKLSILSQPLQNFSLDRHSCQRNFGYL